MLWAHVEANGCSEYLKTGQGTSRRPGQRTDHRPGKVLGKVAGCTAAGARVNHRQILFGADRAGDGAAITEAAASTRIAER